MSLSDFHSEMKTFAETHPSVITPSTVNIAKFDHKNSPVLINYHNAM